MRKLPLILIMTTGLLPLAIAQAAPADLPESGQITCYDNAGIPLVSCAGTGQDGDHRAGVTWPLPRFVAGIGIEADCITDILTGLMWMGKPDSTPRTWFNALANVDGISLCGFDDWRLPNINELESLVNSEFGDQLTWLNAQGFSGVQSGDYWSSSSWAGNPAGAWLVSTIDGSVITTNNKSISIYVWPVRGGQ